MKKIYQILLSVLFLLSLSFTLFAQNSFFTPKSETAISFANNKRAIIPNKYITVQADMAQLKTFLWTLPSEKNVNQNLAPIMQIPMPDGRMVRFRVWQSSIQEPALEAKFPDIKTFAGQGIDDIYASIRFDIGPRGFHAQVLTINGSYYIDPYTVGSNTTDYISYFRKDLMNNKGKWACDVPDYTPTSTNNIIAAACRGTELRTYRLAVACTGEYAQAPGINAGSNPTILHNAIVTSVNRVVGVYRTELSISMMLVATNNLVEFLDAATDPFNGNNNANVLINESQTVCDANIGSGNYDIGHTFSTGGGGLAQLNSPCGSSKARGITGSPNPTGDAYDIDYVAHEMGHQFGGNHSMAGCGSSPNSTKYEVGSGTTIQAYAGICGGENIQPNSDPFFHAISFDEISNFVSGTGSGCGTTQATNNQIPVIGSLSNNGANIPINTPFTLTGTATDPDNDPLTYCWEQWDFSGTGNTAWNAGATGSAGNSLPLFKSRIPKTNGSRTFPDIAVILAGFPANPPSALNGLKGETLSPVARAMKFKLIVRDNKVAGGGVASSGAGGCQNATVFQINVIATAGPFVVTIPNGGESYNGGTSQTITWNVVGTNGAPINCANVMISLSTDGGNTYPTVIAASTANDGSEAVTLPNITTTNARIKVEALGNIFFDISNANFNITAVTNPTFTFVTPSPTTVACGTATAAITLATTSVLSFVTPINLVASGLPGATTVSYSVNPVTPGNSTVVTLNNVNTLAPGTYNITITGTAGAEVKNVQLSYIVSAGAGPAITAQPSAQIVCAGTNASFSITSASATGFQWQLSTTGAGGPWSNITNAGVYSNATTATLNITSVLATMDNYQYRCVTSVLCGSTNSNPALLTVQAAPVVSTQPGNSTVYTGGVAVFSITATGATSYLWQVSPTGCGGPWTNLTGTAPYSGFNTATLTINPTSAAMTGYGYRCVVNGTCAPTATSNCGLLTVNIPVAITSQPSASTTCAGTQTSFTVGVTGTTPAYQWQESINGGGTWNNIINGGVYSGATSAILTLTGVTAGMTGYQYRAVVNGAPPGGSVTSSPAILTVNTAPVITTQPAASSTLCDGNNVTFNTAASGTAVTYQWQLSTTGAGGPWSNIANGGVYSGATTASLTITGATAAMTTYQYRVVASGTCAPNANSNAALLTVNTPITITTQPAAITNICATGSTSLRIAAAGTTPTYQWQLSTAGATGPWTNIVNSGVYGGATTPTLTLTAVTAAMTGYQYRAVVTGAAPCTPVTSNVAVLNVTPQPVITASSTSLLAGQKSTLTVNVTPAPGLTFAWYLNGVIVPGATSNSYIVSVNTLGSYRVIVTSGSGSCQSELLAVTATPSTKLFVFPSPNDGKFTITYYTAGASAANPTKQSIVIYDSYGRRVLNKEYPVKQEYQLHEINMRGSGSGVYFIVLREANGNKIKTGEVIIR